LLTEGRGFLVRCGVDTPWVGWLGVQALDARMSLRTAPWLALGALAEVLEVLPGGLALVWDGPPAWLLEQPLEHRAAFLGLLARLPGLSLHVPEGSMVQELDAPLRIWLHSSEPPQGPTGHAWRQGWLGWVPAAEAAWHLPGLGTAEAPEGSVEAGALWGEVLVPLGALAHLDPEELGGAMAEAQAQLERNISHRLGAGAWPPHFPFSRRRTGWRLALLGGREFVASGGSWEEAARHLATLSEGLRAQLRCPLHLGVSDDSEAACALGRQAMREGHPWRYSLPLPPASPAFSTGLGADPREPAPLELRALVPDPLADLRPLALLRIPSIPAEAAVLAFLRGLSRVPALRWLPPNVPPPGPHTHERPWAPASAFAPVMDVTSALQPALFEDPEWT
jgi:hypothetical protein